MDRKNDNSLEFDDDFDDSLDDEFYQDTLDENFEAGDYDLEGFDDDFEAEFPDDLDNDFEQEAIFDESLMAKEKKSGLNLSFNTIVIVGAVVVGFIVLLVQVAKAPSGGQGANRFVSALSHQGADDGILSENQNEKNAPTKNTEQNKVADTIDSDKTENLSQDQAFLFEPDVLDSMGEELNTIPQPAPIMEVEEVSDTIIETPNIEDVVLGDLSNSTENNQDFLQDQALELQEPRPPVADSGQEGNQIIIDDTQFGDKEIDNSVLSADTMQREEKIDIAIQEVKEELGNAETASPVSIDLSSIENKLDQITSRLDDMDVQMSQIQSEVASQIDSAQRSIIQMEKRVQSAEAKAQRSQKQAVRSDPVKKPVPRKIVPKAPNWELKAAQPGKAWISQKGLAELKSIQVGDRINGLGQIQNIAFENGRWHVIGSAKSLKQ